MIANVTNSIKVMVKVAMTSHTLCQRFVQRASLNNVTFLTSKEGMEASGAVCEEEPSFSTVYSPGIAPQPSSLPSGQPTSSPTLGPKKPQMRKNDFMGFLSIVLLIWFLRFVPICIYGMRKKEPKINHLYDILVVLNDKEDAILENVHHKDIAFFRETRIHKGARPNRWTMNDAPGALEKRYEVQFYDQFDLLGRGMKGPDADRAERSVDHTLVGNKLTTEEIYIHEEQLQIGLIIRVQPAKGVRAGKEREIDRRPLPVEGKGMKVKPPRTDEVFNTPMGHTPATDDAERDTEGNFLQSRVSPDNNTPMSLTGPSDATDTATTGTRRSSTMAPIEEPAPSWIRSDYLYSWNANMKATGRSLASYVSRDAT
jgi:hypothetical protein